MPRVCPAACAGCHKTAGEASRNDPGVCFVPCDREETRFKAHGGSRSVLLYRCFAARMRTWRDKLFSRARKKSSQIQLWWLWVGVFLVTSAALALSAAPGRLVLHQHRGHSGSRGHQTAGLRIAMRRLPELYLERSRHGGI